MICPNYQKECQGDFPFCPYCGYQLEDGDVVYHYTSIDTLNAILNNVKHEPPETATEDSLDYYHFILRATLWAFFNDPLEYRYFFEKVLLYFHRDDYLRRYFQVLRKAFDYAGGLYGTPYIISLSKCRDNLDMWRSYSKTGQGLL